MTASTESGVDLSPGHFCPSLLLHYFREPGAERVHGILEDDANQILIASICVTELARRLLAMGQAADDARSTSLSYASLAERVVPVDTAVAVRAFELTSLSRPRLPLVDALIAACACLSGATLVHRDTHFRTIPEDLLPRMDL